MSEPLLPGHAGDAEGEGAGELIFHWRGRPWRVWRLGTILLVSLLAHAATFYLFQVAYTPTGSLRPPSAQVMILAPDDPAAKATLNEWLRVADPALVTYPPAPSSQTILERMNLRYVPSYATVSPAFKSLEPAASEPRSPVPEFSRPPMPVPIQGSDDAGAGGLEEFSPVPRGNSNGALATSLVFTGPIRKLAPSLPPAFRFSSSQSGHALEPLIYLVGIRKGGGKPWLFRQSAPGENSPGDTALAESARDYLAGLEFRAPESGQEVVWGWATYSWGREIYK